MPRPPLPSIPALVGADHRGYEFQRRELRKTLVALGRLPEPEPEVVDDCECPIDWKEVYRLKKQGQRSEAIRLVQEGLAQRETVDGPDSLVVADTLERLADLHNPKPRQEIELRERAMAIYQKHLEISDRRIGAAARGLALNYSALDEIEEASRWALMAVESHQAASDRNLLLAITLDHLAELRRRADATDEALEYYRLSAEMWKSVRG
ncbi:MAG: tetratricopeptide repeat protein, partial [bacterium]|nr:tetratricopeptide repeat protein [bacterium]